MSQPDLLTTQEVADLLRVTRSSISRWSKIGILTPIRIGGLLRFRRDQVERLLEPNTEPAA